MTPSLEGWPTKAKEAPSPHEVRLTPLDTNPVYQCLGVEFLESGLFFENGAEMLSSLQYLTMYYSVITP